MLLPGHNVRSPSLAQSEPGVRRAGRPFRLNRIWVFVLVTGVFAIAACSPRGTLVVGSFPVEMTLSVVAEGTPQTVIRVLQCEKDTDFGLSKQYYAPTTRRLAHSLPSGGSLLFFVGHNFCRNFTGEKQVPSIDRYSRSVLVWVDDVDDPTVIESYDLGSQSISDEMASAAKVRVSSYDLRFRRLESEPDAVDTFDERRILWLGVGQRGRTRDQAVFYKSQRAHVIRRSEWIYDPGMAASLLDLTWQTQVQGELEKRIRQFSRDWTSNHRALVGKNPIYKSMPTVVPFRRDAEGNWLIDPERTGIHVDVRIGSEDDWDASRNDPTLINGRKYFGGDFVVYDPAEATIYVVHDGLRQIY